MSKKSRSNQSKEEQLMKELKSCMRCKYFWGNNNRCANGACQKKSDKEIKKDNLPDKCKGCSYHRGNGYCFPCMKDLMKK